MWWTTKCNTVRSSASVAIVVQCRCRNVRTTSVVPRRERGDASSGDRGLTTDRIVQNHPAHVTNPPAGAACREPGAAHGAPAPSPRPNCHVHATHAVEYNAVTAGVTRRHRSYLMKRPDLVPAHGPAASGPSRHHTPYRAIPAVGSDTAVIVAAAAQPRPLPPSGPLPLPPWLSAVELAFPVICEGACKHGFARADRGGSCLPKRRVPGPCTLIQRRPPAESAACGCLHGQASACLQGPVARRQPLRLLAAPVSQEGYMLRCESGGKLGGRGGVSAALRMGAAGRE